MQNESTESSSPISGLSSFSYTQRNNIVDEALDLVLTSNLSCRAAVRQLSDDYGTEVISFQHLARLVKATRENPKFKPIDRRAEKCGRKSRLEPYSPGILYVLGFRSAGQGAYNKAIKDLKRDHIVLGIPECQIPTANEVYYAVKNTPSAQRSTYRLNAADYYDEAKVRTATAKYKPNDCLQGDELQQKLFSISENIDVDAHILVFMDASSGIIRRPTLQFRLFNTSDLIKGIKSALKPAPEISLPEPCCPKIIKVDNYPVHRCLSVRQSVQAFKQATNLDIEIKYSLSKVPQSNGKAERTVNVAKAFTKAFKNYIDCIAEKNPNVLKYVEIFWQELLDYIKAWNNEIKRGQALSRTVFHHKYSSPERTGFNVNLIDDCFREYRTVVFKHDRGVELAPDIHLDHDDLDEFRNKEIIVALNPDKLGAKAPAFFKKSKRAELKFIGELVHAEQTPNLKGDKMKNIGEKLSAGKKANALLAADFIAKQKEVRDHKYPNAEEDGKKREVLGTETTKSGKKAYPSLNPRSPSESASRETPPISEPQPQTVPSPSPIRPAYLQQGLKI